MIYNCVFRLRVALFHGGDNYFCMQRAIQKARMEFSETMNEICTLQCGWWRANLWPSAQWIILRFSEGFYKFASPWRQGEIKIFPSETFFLKWNSLDRAELSRAKTSESHQGNYLKIVYGDFFRMAEQAFSHSLFFIILEQTKELLGRTGTVAARGEIY